MITKFKKNTALAVVLTSSMLFSVSAHAAPHFTKDEIAQLHSILDISARTLEDKHTDDLSKINSIFTQIGRIPNGTLGNDKATQDLISGISAYQGSVGGSSKKSSGGDHFDSELKQLATEAQTIVSKAKSR